MQETIALLERHGLTLIEVPRMHDPVCFVSTQRVLLIREGMAEQDRKAAVEWALFAAVTTPAA